MYCNYNNSLLLFFSIAIPAYKQINANRFNWTLAGLKIVTSTDNTNFESKVLILFTITDHQLELRPDCNDAVGMLFACN